MAETSVLQQAKQNTITDFVGRLYVPLKRVLKNCKLSLKMSTIDCINKKKYKNNNKTFCYIKQKNIAKRKGGSTVHQVFNLWLSGF